MNVKYGIMKKVNVDHIRRSVDEFLWERCLANTSVNSKVHIFNKTIKNIMSNYIPHKTIICMTEIHLT